MKTKILLFVLASVMALLFCASFVRNIPTESRVWLRAGGFVLCIVTCFAAAQRDLRRS